MGNFQYISETQLIDRIHSLHQIHKGNIKQAFDLGGISSSIMDFAKQHVDTSSPTALLGSLGELMIPTVLFRINPILGVLATAANVLGFPVGKVISSIFKFISNKLSSGQAPTLDEVNQAGIQAVSAEAGPLESESMFFPLYDLEKQGFINFFNKNAWFGDKRPSYRSSSSNWLENILLKVMGEHKTGSKPKWLIGAFIVWIIKTILLGAGLIAGGTVIKNLLTPHKSETPKTPFSPSSDVPIPRNSSPSHHLTPTGKGQDTHVNDGKNSAWFIPLINNSPEDTLLTWAGYVYEELEDADDSLIHSPAFQKTLNEFKQHYQSGDTTLQVPQQYKSMKQVVDSFV